MTHNGSVRARTRLLLAVSSAGSSPASPSVTNPAAAAVPGLETVSAFSANDSSTSKAATASCPTPKVVIGTGVKSSAQVRVRSSSSASRRPALAPFGCRHAGRQWICPELGRPRLGHLRQPSARPAGRLCQQRDELTQPQERDCAVPGGQAARRHRRFGLRRNGTGPHEHGVAHEHGSVHSGIRGRDRTRNELDRWRWRSAPVRCRDTRSSRPGARTTRARLPDAAGQVSPRKARDRHRCRGECARRGVGQVGLTALTPSPGPDTVTARAAEDQTGLASNWSILAAAICATP